ncbi:MAG: nucleotidyltransferase family protein [Desulfotalea sp.]
MQAMILAAGFGTRLLPYTAKRPKPLFPILNKPLLILTIKRLQNAGFTKIIINCHHLKEQIVEATKNIEGVILQQEDTILGTGGGLRKALAALDDEPLLISNGDIYHNLDFSRLYKDHIENRKSGALVTMALHDYFRFNSVAVGDERVLSFGASPSESLAFSGLHVIEPEILQKITSGEFSCIISRYKELLIDGGKISYHRMDDCFWTDMGTPEDYLALHRGLLLGDIPSLPEFEINPKDYPFCTFNGQKGDFKDWVCLGNATIPPGVSLKEVIVWDGAEVVEGKYVNTILM